MRTISAIAIISLSSLLAASCEDPAANKARALTADPSASSNANSQPGSTSASIDTFAARGTALPISLENSKVEFTGSKVTGKHDGGFNSIKGVIDLVNDKPEDSRVAVEIDVASVYTDADGLTTHLQTGDFFDVTKFPKASFTSTEIVPDAEKGADNYTVTGDLELRGVRKSVTFPATINVTPEAVSVDAEFSINRKDFGILYAGKADDLIRDDVVIRLDLNSPRTRQNRER